MKSRHYVCDLPRGRKADSNMWWIIIGAVIALIVMIVLMVMFTGKTSKLEGGLSACESKGGTCVTTSDCPANSFKSTVFDCGEEKICCVGTPKKCDAGCGDDAVCNQAEGYCYKK